MSLRQPANFVFTLIILSDDAAGMMRTALSFLYGADIPNQYRPQLNVLELYLQNPRQRTLSTIVDGIRIMLARLQCLNPLQDYEPRSIQDALRRLTTPEVYNCLVRFGERGHAETTMIIPPYRELTLQILYKVRSVNELNVFDQFLDDASFVKEYYLSEYENGKLDGFVSERLMDDEETVKVILSQAPLCLQYVSNRLRNTPEFVLIAIDSEPLAAYWIGFPLSHNAAFVLPTIRTLAHMYMQGELSPTLVRALMIFDLITVIEVGELQDDIDVMSMCVAFDGRMLVYASDQLVDMEQVVMIAVSQNGLALGLASDRLRNNITIAIMAVKQNWRAIYAVGERSLRKVLYIVLFVAGLLRGIPDATRALRELWDVLQ